MCDVSLFKDNKKLIITKVLLLVENETLGIARIGDFCQGDNKFFVTIMSPCFSRLRALAVTVTKFFTFDKMNLQEMVVCALILRNRKKRKRRKNNRFGICHRAMASTQFSQSVCRCLFHLHENTRFAFDMKLTPFLKLKFGAARCCFLFMRKTTSMETARWRGHEVTFSF